MDTQAIANRLVELCREVKYREAQAELYSDDARSVEPDGSHWQTVEGREAMAAKIAQWERTVEEVHGIGVTDPLVCRNFFTLKLTFDLTLAGKGRTHGEELAVYEVQDGKIVLEHFFYPT